MIDPDRRRARGAQEGLGQIVSDLLRNVRVVDPDIQEATFAACKEYWPDLGQDDVLVGGYRAGTLNLILDSHARLAEAKNFAGDQLRERINEILAAKSNDAIETSASTSKSLDHARNTVGHARKQREGNYVTRIHFYLQGTK